MTYVRVTENPNMGWSNERRAEASARQKKMHADGTWHADDAAVSRRCAGTCGDRASRRHRPPCTHRDDRVGPSQFTVGRAGQLGCLVDEEAT